MLNSFQHRSILNQVQDDIVQDDRQILDRHGVPRDDGGDGMTYCNKMTIMNGDMRGFTLMELLIGVAIMTILSAVGLTSFNFSLMKSRDSQRKSDLSLLAKAVHQFANDFGDYPADNGSGRILGCNASAGAVLVECVSPGQFSVYVNGAQEIYLSKTPNDPNGSYNYYYRKNTDGFSLFSILENTNDASYNTDAGPGILCGISANCNYELTEAGNK